MTAARELAKAVKAIRPGASGPTILTDWQPDYSFRRYVTKSVWDALNSPEGWGEILSVAIQQAHDDVASKGGGYIRLPAATFLIDGMKGAASSFDINRRGGLLLDDGDDVHWVGVRGATVWKNAVDNWRCIVSVKDPRTFSFEGIEFDGDQHNHPCVALSTDDIRGELINFWGSRPGIIKNSHIANCGFFRSGHYAIGVQSSSVLDLSIYGNYGDDIGGDFIAIKDFPATTPKQAIKVYGNTVGKIGTNWQARVADGDGPQAAFDLRGAVQAWGNVCLNLDSYDVTQVGNDGFRVNSDVVSSGRRGGDRTILTNNRVLSAKLDTQGSASAKRIRGLVVADDSVIVNGFIAENCYIGAVVGQVGDGDSVPSYVQLHGIHAKNCKGADGTGTGISLNAGTKGHSVYGIVEKCDVGLVCNATGSRGHVTRVECTLGDGISPDVMRQNDFSFEDVSNTVSSSLSGYSRNNMSGGLTIWDELTASLVLRSTRNGTVTGGQAIGRIVSRSEDTSGAGAAERASLDFVATGASNAGESASIKTTGAGGALTEALLINESLMKAPITVFPPYANDAAATAGGVVVGQLYHNTTSGSLAQRRA